MYYAYELINPVNNIPFYVGKGKQYRAYYHLRETLDVIKKNLNQETSPRLNWHKINTIKTILSKGLKIRYCFYNCDSEELAIKKEKELISQWGRENNNTGILTNLTDGGDGGITRERAVSQFNKFGELIKTWTSAKEAGLSLDSNYSGAITSCCIGKETSWKGFLWAYIDKQPKMLKNVRVVYQWSIDGKFINRYISCADAARINNYDNSTISGSIRKQKIAYGFRWTNSKTFPS